VDASVSGGERETPAADEARAHRVDVDARLFRESKQQLALQADFPVTQPDHPDFLLARNAAVDALRLQRTPKQLATDVGITKTSTWIASCRIPAAAAAADRQAR
jgi:hypothetical protein